jgi:hypothetical protein
MPVTCVQVISMWAKFLKLSVDLAFKMNENKLNWLWGLF